MPQLDVFDIALGGGDEPQRQTPQRGQRQASGTMENVFGGLLKGILEGSVDLGSLVEDYRDLPGLGNPMQAIRNFGQSVGEGKGFREIWKEGPDYSQKQKLPEDRTEFSQGLDTYVPGGEGFAGGASRKAGQLLPFAFGPGQSALGSVLTAGAGGIAGQGAKEFGFGETGQAVAELIPFLAGGWKGAAKQGLKKPPSKTAQAIAGMEGLPASVREAAAKRLAQQQQINEMIALAEKSGVNPEKITPLIQGEGKTAMLTPFAKQNPPTKALSGAQTAVADISNQIGSGKYGKLVLPEASQNKMLNEIDALLSKMPNEIQGLIKADLKQLASSPMAVEDLMKFYADVNYHYSPKTRKLGLIKGPLMEAMATVNPQLANDFALSNKMWSKYFDISKKLKPGTVDQIFSTGTKLGMLGGLMTGNAPLLGILLRKSAASKLSSAMLTNPKYQNLASKLASAINSGKFVAASKLKDSFAALLRKDHPEAAAQLQKEDWDEFLSLLDKDGAQKPTAQSEFVYQQSQQITEPE